MKQEVTCPFLVRSQILALHCRARRAPADVGYPRTASGAWYLARGRYDQTSEPGDWVVFGPTGSDHVDLTAVTRDQVTTIGETPMSARRRTTATTACTRSGTPGRTRRSTATAIRITALARLRSSRRPTACSRSREGRGRCGLPLDHGCPLDLRLPVAALRTAAALRTVAALRNTRLPAGPTRDHDRSFCLKCHSRYTSEAELNEKKYKESSDFNLYSNANYGRIRITEREYGGCEPGGG